MIVSPAELEAWQSAVGRTVKVRQWLDRESLRRFQVALGEEPDMNDALPPLAAWAWFLDSTPRSRLGSDGHPRRGGFLPAVTLPRRMFAAARLVLLAPLELEAEAEMTSKIMDVRHRRGASGDLVLIDVERRVSQDGTPRTTESQTIVYREAGLAGPLPQLAEEPQITPAGGTVWDPDEVDLFRFSAATFDAHRIHYDQDYAREVEGYPALVVQGPQTAARLANLAGRDGEVAAIEFRLLAPLYVNQPVRLLRTGEGEYSALRCDGEIATILTASFR